jgi:hypothetical protein
LQTDGRLPLFLWIDDRTDNREGSADSPSGKSTDTLHWLFLIFGYLFRPLKLIIAFFKTPQNTGSNGTPL